MFPDCMVKCWACGCSKVVLEYAVDAGPRELLSETLWIDACIHELT